MKPPEGISGKALCECCGNHDTPYGAKIFGKGYCKESEKVTLCPPNNSCFWWIPKETPMEYLQVRKDRVMALAAKGCQFKEAMETLWPKEFEEKPLIGRMGDIYKRNDDLYLLARTEIGAKDLYILINLPDGNLWDTPFPATFAHKITLPESFTKDAHVELMTGKIVLER